MLKVLRADTPAGRRALERLFRTRAAPDFGALRDALPIVEGVLAGGRKALAHFVAELDGESVRPARLVVDPGKGAAVEVDPAFARAFRLAVRRVRAYHERQRPSGFAFRDALGASFREEPIPHEAVGVYVPGGRAFYPSSLLMAAVPARVAGVKRLVVATPPRAFRESAALRWALRELSIGEVLLAGGAHGIAGLVSVCGCTKIVGPGNRWVAAAKHLVSGLVSIDLPAGPSEILIVASRDADPARIAADLLAQAEHDPDALCLLFTDRVSVAEGVVNEVGSQLATLPTATTARKSLTRSGLAIVFPSLDAAIRAGSRVAAEHVQVMGKRARAGARALARTAGALFIGEATPTAFGDYIAGPNHVLPTGGAARSFSGLSTRDFVRYSRTVELPPRAARALARPAATLARVEGLEAHARSLELRR
jgi:histidinol dehydrogenase